MIGNRTRQRQRTSSISWLSSVFAKLERWPQATEAALHAVQLDPLSHSLLFHLSHCYEQEREYVKAHEYFERAVSLVPPFDNGPHAAKPLRLKEQADDQKAHVFRGDPMEMLPLEIVIAIMQEGLLGDKYFVLRNTWVCQRWRNTLINLKELWSCLRYASAELKDKSYDSKRETWIKRAGTKLDTICFKGLTVTNVARLTKARDAPLLEDIRSIEMSTKEPLALNRFCQKFPNSCNRLQHITIDGGYDTWNRKMFTNPEKPPPGLCGDLPSMYVGPERIKTFRLSNIDFRDPGLPVRSLWDFGSEQHSFYKHLTSLSMVDCAFNNKYSPARPVVPPDIAQDGVYQSDPLHRTLRWSKKLEYLCVVAEGKTSPEAAKPGIGTRTALPSLHTAILPPPSVWSIDIDAPNLRKLHFVFTSRWEFGFEKWDFTQSPSAPTGPLIPTLANSPVSPDSLMKLEDLAFQCNYQDDISGLEEWISQTPNLTTLSLSGYGMPYPRKLATTDIPDNRAQIRILQLLIDHPEYVPRLTELKLEYCWTTGEKLIEFIKQRKTSDGTAPIERLTLNGCSMLSKADLTTVKQEVRCFESTRAMPDQDTGDGEYGLRHFSDAECESRYSQGWL